MRRKSKHIPTKKIFFNYTKNGSKWVTMPEQMMMYRAAAFFARVFCPHALMGLQTAEEVQDVNGYDEPTQTKTITFNREDDK